MYSGESFIVPQLIDMLFHNNNNNNRHLKMISLSLNNVSSRFLNKAKYYIEESRYYLLVLEMMETCSYLRLKPLLYKLLALQ